MRFCFVGWLLGGVLLLEIMGCGAAAAERDSAQPRVVSNTSAVISGEPHSQPDMVEVFGIIAQEPENVTDVFSPQAGVVKSVLVKANQSVEVRTPLIQVENNEGRPLDIISDRRGIVVGPYVQEGVRVDPVTSLMTIADMDHLRGSFDIHEREIGKVRLGQEVIMESLSYPGKVFRGKVVFLAPQLDEETKSMKVRVDIDNTAHALRYGMFVDGKILIRPEKYEEYISETTASAEEAASALKSNPEGRSVKTPGLKVVIAPDNTGVIQTAKASRGRLKIYLDVLGVTASDTEKTLKVFPGGSGVLQQILVSPGDVLTLGQPVFTYQSENHSPLVTVQAPRPGVVVSLEAKAGESVSPRRPLMTFSDTGNLSCIFDIYEPDIGRVHQGQAIVMSSPAFPDSSFRGSIISISPRVDQNSRSIKIRVQTENPEGKLKFGMFLTGKILVEERDALLIPVMAVHKIQDQPVVFASADGETFSPREVRLGGQSDGEVEILGGLQEGDLLISHGGLLVKEEMSHLGESHA